MRIGHQAAAQATWLSYCALNPTGWQEIVCGAVVASSMCADDWSPDVDQGGYIAKILPGGHRGLTHMPEVVIAALWVVNHFLAGRGYDWFALGAGAAWLSHLTVDFGWGRIPFLLLGGRRLGFKLNTGGPAERVVTWALSGGCLPLAWVAFGATSIFPWPGGLP